MPFLRSLAMINDVLILIFLLVLGVASLYGAKQQFQVLKKTKNWLKVQAVLKDKWLGEPKISFDSIADRSIYVFYTYEVYGHTYNGENVFANDVFGGASSGTPNALKSNFDKIVTNPIIYYNPDEPSQSFIFPETSFLAYFLSFTGIFLILADALYLLYLSGL